MDAFPSDAYQMPRVQYVPANVRPRNPNIVASWRALWGIPDIEWSESALKIAMENKRRIRKEKGDDYPAWVLDRAGIEIALSNRVTIAVRASIGAVPLRSLRRHLRVSPKYRGH